ncbi:MAG: hypothetical protein WCV91_03935 [Candidatus Margulisiibacteriota bacterium]
MRYLNRFSKALAGILSVIFCFSFAGAAKAEKQPKDKLLGQLSDLKREPQEVKAPAAMCYTVVRPQMTVSFHCDKCGNISVFNKNSGAGNIAECVESIKYLSKKSPDKIKYNSTRLCKICKKAKSKLGIDVFIKCFSCSKEIAWDVTTPEDLRIVRPFLFSPEIQSNIDKGVFISRGSIEAVYQDDSGYIIEHVFCGDCKKKLKP